MIQPRIHCARFLIKLGRFVQELSVTVLRPRDLIEFSRQSYAKANEVNAWAAGPWLEKGLTPEEVALEKELPIEKGRLFLLGAGGGREAIFFARKGVDVVAVDFIPEMVAAAQDNIRLSGVQAEVYVQEVSTLTLPEHAYDYVWISMSLYSAVPTRKKRVRMLKNLGRGLKPGGVLFCQFHWDPKRAGSLIRESIKRAFAILSLGNFRYETGDMLWGNSEFIHAFTAEDKLRSEFRDGGFKVLSIHFNADTRRAGAILRKFDSNGQ